MPWIVDEKVVTLVYSLVRQRRARLEPAPLDWSARDIEHRRQGLTYRKATCQRCCSRAAKECFVASGSTLPSGPLWVDLCTECGGWLRESISVLPAV